MESLKQLLFPMYAPEDEKSRELIELVASIRKRDPNDKERGYIARMLVQACFLYQKIAGNEFSRVANSFEMTIMAPSEVGLPLGLYQIITLGVWYGGVPQEPFV